MVSPFNHHVKYLFRLNILFHCYSLNAVHKASKTGYVPLGNTRYSELVDTVYVVPPGISQWYKAPGKMLSRIENARL